jgi:starch phosphorylase
LGAEFVLLRDSSATNKESIKIYPLHLDKTEGSKLYFSTTIKSSEAGPFKVALRIYPDNKDLPHRMDFAYVKWVNI